MDNKKQLPTIESVQAGILEFPRFPVSYVSSPFECLNAGLQRFRRVARLVLILLKAVGRRRETREETNYNFLSWTVVYDEVLGISRLNYDSGTLTFDPLLFKANRESPLSQDIKDILRLPPEHRTEAHIRAVMMSFHNVIPSFSEYPKEIQQSMIKVCKYEKFESGRVIIRQGHRAENFYFIIGGSAVVTQMDSEAGNVHTTNVLGKGNSFGELAFLQMSKRSATVTCRDDVELLCIERDDFIDIFMRPRKGDEPDHIKFLKSVDILRGWPVSLLPHVNPKICAFTYVRRGVILCLDNAHSDWIFVVYSGSCKVLKALDDGPVPGLDGKGHSTEIQTEGSLASNTSNFPQAGKPTTSSASSDNILVHDHRQGGSRCRRLRKYGVSLPAIHTSRDGRGVSLPTVHTSRDGRGVSLPTVHTSKDGSGVTLPAIHTSQDGRGVSMPTVHTSRDGRGVSLPTVHTLRDGHGTSLPVLGSSSTEGQTNRNSAKVSFSDIDHLADIDRILYQKHILPTILRSNQADQENSQETRKVSIRTRILPKSDPIFKPKRQSYGLQPPVLPHLTKPSGETTTTPDQHQHLRKMAFVEVARLEPGDVFGLEHVVLSGIRNVASCSLVSQGAEVVLISKSFFKKHLTEDTLKRMRQLIRPLPSEKALQKKFQKKKLWDMYKSHALSRHRSRVRGAAPQC